METPPPYRKPSSGQQADNVIKMTKPKLIVLLVACMLAGALVGFGVTVNVLTRPLRSGTAIVGDAVPRTGPEFG